MPLSERIEWGRPRSWNHRLIQLRRDRHREPLRVLRCARDDLTPGLLRIPGKLPTLVMAPTTDTPGPATISALATEIEYDATTLATSVTSIGARSYGIDLCGTMALYVDQALVVRFLLPKMMGIYVVALSLSRMLNAFHTSVIVVLFPRAVSQTAGIIHEMTSRAMRMSTLQSAVDGGGT